MNVINTDQLSSRSTTTCFTCLEVSPGNQNFNTTFGPKQCLFLIHFHFHRLFTSHPVNSIYLMDYFGSNIERTRLTKRKLGRQANTILHEVLNEDGV